MNLIKFLLAIYLINIFKILLFLNSILIRISKIRKIIFKNKPNYIVNFAAQGMVAESWIKPNDWYQTNIIGQVKLISQIKIWFY